MSSENIRKCFSPESVHRLVQDGEIVDRQVHGLAEAIVRDRKGSACENDSSDSSSDRGGQTQGVHDLVDNFEEGELDEVRHDRGLEKLLDLLNGMLGKCDSYSLPSHQNLVNE